MRTPARAKYFLFYVLLVCKCVLYYCHRVSTQLQLTNISISKRSRKAIGPTQPRIFSQGVRRPRTEAYFYLVPTFIMCGVRPLPPYAFMAWTGTLIIIIIIIIIQCFIINVLAQQLKHWGYGCELFSKSKCTSSPFIGSVCLRLSKVSLTKP